MRAAFGAVAGALTVGALLLSYNLGERRAFSSVTMPATQMVVGPDGVARPYLVQAGQAAYAQPVLGQPMGQSAWPAYGPAATPYGYTAPGGVYTVPTNQQYVTERVVERPVVRRAATRQVSSEVRSRRSWQKSALLIGGSAGAGAGMGALIGGKKGALAGAAIGGGAAAIYDQVKRH